MFTRRLVPKIPTSWVRNTQVALERVKAASYNLFQQSSYNETSGGIFGSSRRQSDLSNIPLSRFKDTQSYMDAYRQVTSVYVCVNTLANSIAGLPFNFLDQTGKEKYTLGQVEPEENSLASLLENPNPYQTFYELVETTVAHLELTGNSIWLLENMNADGHPECIYPLNPANIKIAVDPKRGLLGYLYQQGENRIVLDRDEVLHFKYANPDSFFWGLGTIASILGALDTEINMSDSIRALYQNGAVIPGAFVSKDNLSPVQFERLKSQLMEENTGVTNFFRPLVLDGGLDWKSMTVGHTDLGTLDLRRYTQEEIFMAFGVPVSEAGHQGKANVKNDHLTRVYWESTILPKTHRIEDTLRPFFRRYDKGVRGKFQIPTNVIDTELLDNLQKVDTINHLTTPEIRKIFRLLLGTQYGLDGMKDDIDIKELPLLNAQVLAAMPPPPPMPPPGPEDTGLPESPPPAGQLPPPQADAFGNLDGSAHAFHAGTMPSNLVDLTGEHTGDHLPDLTPAQANKVKSDNMDNVDSEIDEIEYIEIEDSKGGTVGPGTRGGLGARGGQYYINSKGKVIYGHPPKGTHGTTAVGISRQQQSMARQELKNVRSESDITSLLDPSWSVGQSGTVASPTGQYHGYGKNKDAAIADATGMAQQHPDTLYALVKVMGSYMIAAKKLSDFDLSKPKVTPGVSNLVAPNRPQSTGYIAPKPVRLTKPKAPPRPHRTAPGGAPTPRKVRAHAPPKPKKPGKPKYYTAPKGPKLPKFQKQPKQPKQPKVKIPKVPKPPKPPKRQGPHAPSVFK